MAKVSCPNCGTCTCTGSHLTTSINGIKCCTACVNSVNQQYTKK